MTAIEDEARELLRQVKLARQIGPVVQNEIRKLGQWSEYHLGEVLRLLKSEREKNRELTELLCEATGAAHEEEFGGVTDADRRRFEAERRLEKWRAGK